MKRAKLSDFKDDDFRKQPKALDEEYYKNLSIHARYLYGIMFDRFRLSRYNNWQNDKQEVYFVFKQKELAHMMNVSIRSIKRYMKELEKYQLIEKENTITVNKYYITLEFQQGDNLALRGDSGVTTRGQGCPDYSKNDLNKNELKENELLHQQKVEAYMKIDEIDNELIQTVHRLLKRYPNYNRKNINKENYEWIKYSLIDLDEELEEMTFDIEKAIEDYVEIYPNANRSIEHFITCLGKIYDRNGYSGDTIYHKTKKLRLVGN